MKKLSLATFAVASLLLFTACSSDSSEPEKTAQSTDSSSAESDPADGQSPTLPPEVTEIPAEIQTLIKEIPVAEEWLLKDPEIKAKMDSMSNTEFSFGSKGVPEAWGLTADTVTYGLSKGTIDVGLAKDDFEVSEEDGKFVADVALDEKYVPTALVKDANLLYEAVLKYIKDNGEPADIDFEGDFNNTGGNVAVLSQSFFSDAKEDTLPTVKVKFSQTWRNGASSAFDIEDYLYTLKTEDEKFTATIDEDGLTYSTEVIVEK